MRGCAFVNQTSMLNCAGSNAMVECEASLRWDGDFSFNLMGIADNEQESPVAKSFRLLPRSVDNSKWEEDVRGEKRISLYQSEKLDNFGLRVLDEQCFEKLTSLLNDSNRREKVFLSDNKSTAVLRCKFLIFDFILIRKNKLKLIFYYFS